jgi:hypothetical protein
MPSFLPRYRATRFEALVEPFSVQEGSWAITALALLYIVFMPAASFRMDNLRAIG